jgi:hypothetical protein
LTAAPDDMPDAIEQDGISLAESVDELVMQQLRRNDAGERHVVGLSEGAAAPHFVAQLAHHFRLEKRGSTQRRLVQQRLDEVEWTLREKTAMDRGSIRLLAPPGDRLPFGSKRRVTRRSTSFSRRPASFSRDGNAFAKSTRRGSRKGYRPSTECAIATRSPCDDRR